MSPAQTTNHRSARAKKRVLVLIVEDEEPIAETLALVIEEAGYTPMVAMHGQQALELAREQWPSLVITDLMMPYMDGATLIAQLRDDAERHGHPSPPVIVMTAAGPKRAQEAQADLVVHKPFDLDEIDQLLHRYLD